MSPNELAKGYSINVGNKTIRVEPGAKNNMLAVLSEKGNFAPKLKVLNDYSKLMCKGFCCFKKAGEIWFDPKADNILIQQNGKLCISDFIDKTITNSHVTNAHEAKFIREGIIETPEDRKKAEQITFRAGAITLLESIEAMEGGSHFLENSPMDGLVLIEQTRVNLRNSINRYKQNSKAGDVEKNLIFHLETALWMLKDAEPPDSNFPSDAPPASPEELYRRLKGSDIDDLRNIDIPHLNK